MSSFVGSGLEVVLSSLGVTQLVIAGASTSTAVLGTAMAAADVDFGLDVLSDACFDARANTHDLLMEAVFPAMATVLSVEEWVASVER
jgi:nicotinamidase-related amidase